ncbi:MAG TPA: hypothetical protein VFM88_05820 [Vicinamibacteria bacterium]|nr:hypothetical protein [Vicinamibacteria bacterium]
MTVLRLAASTAFMCALLAPPLNADSSEFRWTGRLAAGQTIELKGVNGSITAEPSPGGEVEVIADRHGRRDDPDEVEIRTIEHAGGVTICAVYPSAHAVRANRCEPGEGGHLGADKNDVEVDFRVRVPEGVNFAGRTVNGGVEAEGLGGDVVATTVNGAVRATGRGVVRGQSVNGSVFARLGRADWPGKLSYSTVNGAITIELPADASTEVRASTVNGGIHSDFPLAVKGRWGPQQARGTLGAGGRSLELETVNGAIRLVKR